MDAVPKRKRNEIEKTHHAHKGFLLNLAFRYVREQSLAEDIVHDAMVRLLQNHADYDLSDTVRAKGLVAKIVIGLSLDLLKRSSREIPAPLDEMQPISEDAHPLEDSSEYYLSQLTPDDAYIIRKLILEGWSVRDIAKQLQCTEPALRKRLQRAKEQLRKIIEEDIEPKREVRL